jgi:hypothetical protein
MTLLTVVVCNHVGCYTDFMTGFRQAAAVRDRLAQEGWAVRPRPHLPRTLEWAEHFCPDHKPDDQKASQA